MKRLLIQAGAESERWRQAFAAALPDWHCLDHRAEPASIDVIAGWAPAADALRPFTGLKLYAALGAGVDRLLARSDLPPEVLLLRLHDAGMAEQMLEYALLGVLAWQRQLRAYAELQARAEWQRLPPRTRRQTRVGVLGLGEIGGRVASGLAAMGYTVSGWSRNPRQCPGVDCMAGMAALPQLLARSDVLINLLPSTPATRGLLDRERLAQLPQGAVLVQASRGDQFDAEALIECLDRGHLELALLDVFAIEPLPASSPLWRHPRIRITPHAAAITLIEPAVAQLCADLRRWERGERPLALVERARGY